MTITWSLATIIVDRKINNYKKYTSNAGHFDGSDDVPVQYSVHCVMMKDCGFSSSHWMTPSGKYFNRIALADAMVINFGGQN
jgi:hypothetical protein